MLLRDFDHWYRQIPMRLPGTSRMAFEEIRQRVVQALSAVALVEAMNLTELRKMAEDTRRTDEFIICLDAGTYFEEYDFSFSMTRAVTRLSDVQRGRSIRVARQGSGQFWTQVANLRRLFEQAEGRRIVICDDGIDTGRSLSEVIRQLKAQFLEVSELRVLLNPHGLEEIEGVPITTLLPEHRGIWSHERDMYWGSPGGGVSLIVGNNVNNLGGVPYSLTTPLLKTRLGFSHDDLSDLRGRLLMANRDFWSLLSRAAGRPLRIRDSKRLAWIEELSDSFSDNTPIHEVVEYVVANEPSL